MSQFCFNYTKFNLNVIAIIITVLLFALLFKFANNTNNVNIVIDANYTNTEEVLEEKDSDVNLNISNNVNSENFEWKIEIPQIELSAQIGEGTNQDILNVYVGHFETTSKEYGNIALAAHNRGYDVNYFARLKELEIGDEVIYTYKNLKRNYQISSKNIIKDTDVEILKETNENILTLITCVENEPNLRRCLIAKEKI